MDDNGRRQGLKGVWGMFVLSARKRGRMAAGQIGVYIRSSASKRHGRRLKGSYCSLAKSVWLQA